MIRVPVYFYHALHCCSPEEEKCGRVSAVTMEISHHKIAVEVNIIQLVYHN